MVLVQSVGMLQEVLLEKHHPQQLHQKGVQIR
jgi:hypothetical protein